ncbi:MAG: peptide deformylase, partial [Lentisphaeria bacterium]|nr:peptide deformylase [Lentisphaeria bacterium]NQZ68064.1 peptide deformylase [Lentisphaeria bacterium]
NFSKNHSEIVEGCLSIPDVTGGVSRPELLDLEYTGLDEKRHNYRCGGLLARCIQHEMDHLLGKLFLEYISEEDYEEALPILKILEKENKKAKK